jgi:hypothetical protein
MSDSYRFTQFLFCSLPHHREFRPRTGVSPRSVLPAGGVSGGSLLRKRRNIGEVLAPSHELRDHESRGTSYVSRCTTHRHPRTA